MHMDPSKSHVVAWYFGGRQNELRTWFLMVSILVQRKEVTLSAKRKGGHGLSPIHSFIHLLPHTALHRTSSTLTTAPRLNFECSLTGQHSQHLNLILNIALISVIPSSPSPWLSFSVAPVTLWCVPFTLLKIPISLSYKTGNMLNYLSRKDKSIISLSPWTIHSP